MDDYEKKPCNQSADPVSTGIMMSTLWNQSGVISITGNSTITYNEYCPLDGIRHSLTGCTNTAAAQIIYYFIEKYDLDLNLTLTNDDEYTSSISIKADGSTPGTTSFSKINEKLSDFDLNSADDIAALTYACGVIQHASYGASATSTAWNEELFLRAGFSCAIISSTDYQYYWRTDPDDKDSPISDAGFEVLIENLTAGRVVGTSYPGHALVIDGYDGSTDKFHINFGWGNSSATAWYSREEIREKGYLEFVYDLMIDGPTTLTVNDGDLYGTGTMLRAFEQANGISGDNIIEFDDSVKNQTLELLDGITLKENIIIDNFNMSIIVTDDPSGMAFYLSENCTAAFNDFSGDLFINTAKNNNYAFYAYSGEGITLKTDNASIFSGQFKVNNSLSNGCAAVKNAMAAYRSADRAIDTNIINSRRCAVYGSKNSDDILLTNSTIVIGNIILADGDDDISIIGNSHLAGDINAGNGNDTVIIDSSSSVAGFFYSIENIQFELLSLPHTQAMFHIMTNVYNVFNAKYISVDITQAETGSYVLFEADDDASYAEYLSKFSITVTSDNITQDIVMTAGDNCSYADLICENNQLILNVKIDDTSPDKPTVQADITSITNLNVTVSATFSSDSAVREYSFDNKNWKTYTTGIKFKQNGIIYFRGRDKAGNYSDVTSYRVTNIDRNVPDKPTADADVKDITNGDVIVTAAFNDDSVIKEYSLDNKIWNTYTTGVLFKQNGVVYFRAKNASGNISEVTQYAVTNIDKIAPVVKISGNTDSMTDQEVILSVEAEDDASGIKSIRYSFDNSSWNTGTTVTVDSNRTVYFKVTDRAGNVTKKTVVISNIDKKAPDTPTASADITGATNKNVTVTAEFDNDADVKEYSFDRKIWHTYTTGVVMEANGTVYFRGKDKAGNVSEVAKYKVANIDKTAPAKPAAHADITAVTNRHITVYATFSRDAVTRQYSFDNRNWKEYNSGVVVTTNGNIFFRAEDVVGNVSEITIFKVDNIDKTAPDAPCAIADITGATNKDVTVYATFSRDTVTRQYSFDNKNWKAYTSGVVMTANGSVFFRAKDAAGNVSEVTTYRVSNIDKTQPDTIIPKAGKITVSQISGKQNDLLISMSKFSDNKGIDGYIIKVNGKVVEDDFKGNSYTWHGENLAGKVNVEVIAFDAAGNQSKAVKKKITIKDVTPPEKVTGITVKSATEKATVITWNAAKDNVGVTQYEVVVNGKKYKSKTNSITIKKLKAGTATCTVYALDKAKLKTASETFTFDVADGTNPKAGKITVSQVNGKQNDLLISMSKFSDNKGIDGYIIKVNGKVVEDDFKGNSYTWHGENLAGKKVNVEVIAFDAAGNQSKAAKKKITIKDITPPEKVTGLKVVSANEKEVKLSWNAASDNVGVTQYEVVINGKTYKSKTNSITIKKLKAGTHEFKVYAVDKAKKKSIASDSQNIVIGGTAENTFSRILNAGDNSITLQKSQTAVSPGIEKNKYIDMGSGNDTLSLFDDIELQAELINFGDGNDKFIIGDDGNYLSSGLSAADFGSGDDLFDISKEAVVEFSHDTALHFGDGDDTMILNGVLETGSIDGLENISGNGELIVHGNIDEDLVDKFKTAGIKVTLA